MVGEPWVWRTSARRPLEERPTIVAMRSTRAATSTLGRRVRRGEDVVRLAPDTAPHRETKALPTVSRTSPTNRSTMRRAHVRGGDPLYGAEIRTRMCGRTRGSVLFGEKEGRGAAVGLGDNPECVRAVALARLRLVDRVGRQEPHAPAEASSLVSRSSLQTTPQSPVT
jgi:antitoxin (DNA-binding transcriptional repressor) of toxin-antitoxin stability system